MKKRLRRVIISSLLFILGIILGFINKDISKIVFVITYVVIGYDIILKALKNIFKGQVLDENFLMMVATVGAFFIGELSEAVGVMLFYQIGELFQSYAVRKSRKSISDLMDIRPDYANVKNGNSVDKKDPYDVKVGDLIIVGPGEKIPLDGIVVNGEARLNTSSLTGESVPRKVRINDSVISGCINLDGVLEIKVIKEYSESTVSKILDLVENASSQKAQTENFISKFARVYTPIVVISAVLIAVIPGIFDGEFAKWIYRALTFLVVSCPCALVISIPLSFFGGLGGASKNGILIKGSNFLEALSRVKMVVSDKTGTLTKGNFEVQKINCIDEFSKDEFIRLVAYAENYSNHPIAESIKKYYGKEIDASKIKETREIAGEGIVSNINGKKVSVGNKKMLINLGVDETKFNDEENVIGTIVYVVIDDKFIGSIIIADEIKKDAKEFVDGLKKNGINKIVMLSGDMKNLAENVAKKIGIEEVYSELLPENKVEKVEEFLKEKDKNSSLIFIGDGINDAPVLARADIGIAMGALGSDAAIEAADIVIMTDEPLKILTAIKLSKKTLKIVKQNIWFAILVKVGVLILSALGLTNMWAAVFADVGVSIIAILNAMRCLSSKI